MWVRVSAAPPWVPSSPNAWLSTPSASCSATKGRSGAPATTKVTSPKGLSFWYLLARVAKVPRTNCSWVLVNSRAKAGLSTGAQLVRQPF